jgi:hypothetical protein
MAASFQTISSTREEYIATLESIKASAPTEPKSNEKRSKLEQSHLALVKALEDRIEVIDHEIAVSARSQFDLFSVPVVDVGIVDRLSRYALRTRS